MIDFQYFEGGLVREPDVRTTNQGSGVVSFTLAQTAAKKLDDGSWETTRARYLPVTMFDTDRVQWSQVLGGLPKGTKLVVRGQLVTRQWEQNGQRRERLEVNAAHVYVDASNASQQPAQTTQDTTDAWSNSPNGPSSPQGGFGQISENPPF